MEKERKWDCQEMERQISREIDNLVGLAPEGEQDGARQKVEEIMEMAGDMAFMQGYMYAIDVLKESIVRK